MISCLYVDDEPGLLEVAKIFLESEGTISVATCDSPLRVPSMLEEGDFDIIVSDYQMPEMDGLRLFQEVRGRGCEVPFILFTGKGREEVAITALNIGIDFYLPKGGDARAQFTELGNVIMQLVRRKEAEDAVSYNNRRFRLIIENVLDLVLMIDRKGLIKYASPSVFRSLGYKPEELMGTFAFDYLHREDRHIQSKLQAWNGAAVNDHPHEFRLRNRRGEYRWYEGLAKPMPSEFGQGSFVLSCWMIDDRKRMELEIIKREKLLRTVYDNSNELIVIVAFDGTMQFVNRKLCETSGYKAEELVSRYIIDFVPSSQREQALLKLKEKMLSLRERTEYRTAILCKDGKEVPVKVTSQRIDDPGGEPFIMVMGVEEPSSQGCDRCRKADAISNDLKLTGAGWLPL